MGGFPSEEFVPPGPEFGGPPPMRPAGCVISAGCKWQKSIEVLAEVRRILCAYEGPS